MMKIISGTVIKVEAAAICPHITPLAEIRLLARIGNVKAFLEVITSAMINSFQLNIKTSIAVEAIAGAVSGKMILNNTPNLLHPSMSALSSISAGISKKNERSIQMAKAKLNAV
jgi:hypothetical protein